jgi:hypothetical protein
MANTSGTSETLASIGAMIACIVLGGTALICVGIVMLAFVPGH